MPSPAFTVWRAQYERHRSEAPIQRSWDRLRLRFAALRLATEKHPGTNGERRVENRKRHQQMRKHARYGQGHEHRRYEHQSVEHGSGDDLSRARTTAEQVKPADNRNRHTNHTNEPFLVSNKSWLHEKRLGRARPGKEECSGPQVDDAVHRRVLGRCGQRGGLVEKTLDECQLHYLRRKWPHEQKTRTSLRTLHGLLRLGEFFWADDIVRFAVEIAARMIDGTHFGARDVDKKGL